VAQQVTFVLPIDRLGSSLTSALQQPGSSVGRNLAPGRSGSDRITRHKEHGNMRMRFSTAVSGAVIFHTADTPNAGTDASIT
jgi:hypothetical protein